MLDAFKTLVTNQYEAALSMLRACVDRCPDTVWNSRGANYKFCQLVFHTLIFTDLYLGPDVESFRRQPFHLRNERFLGDYEEFEDRAPVRYYDKASILAYLEHCRGKVSEVMEGETADTLSAPAGTRRSLFTSRAPYLQYPSHSAPRRAIEPAAEARHGRGRRLGWIRLARGGPHH